MVGCQPAVLQENLLVKCPGDLPSVNGKKGADWIKMSVEWRSQYNECITRQHGLIDAVNQKKR